MPNKYYMCQSCFLPSLISNSNERRPKKNYLLSRLVPRRVIRSPILSPADSSLFSFDVSNSTIGVVFVWKLCVLLRFTWGRDDKRIDWDLVTTADRVSTVWLSPLFVALDSRRLLMVAFGRWFGVVLLTLTICCVHSPSGCGGPVSPIGPCRRGLRLFVRLTVAPDGNTGVTWTCAPTWCCSRSM